MSTQTKHIDVNIGISEENKLFITSQLNRLLANEYFLYTKTRKFHWNVEGSNFISLHSFFEEQYDELATIIDQVAERVRNLGHYAFGSFKEFNSVSDLHENDKESGNAEDMIEELKNDHETIVRIIRHELIPMAGEYKDVGTEDFLTGLLEQHETNAWKLRALIK